MATAVVPLPRLRAGRAPSKLNAFATITAPVKVPPPLTGKKRKIRVSLLDAHLSIEDLLARLDEAGRLGTDIACTYELVWIAGPDKGQIDRMTQTAQAAAGPSRRQGPAAQDVRAHCRAWWIASRRNEAILFDREGKEAGRYLKIAKTHPEMVPGDAAKVLETDFGRIGVRICADEWMVELDRCYAIQGADIVFTPTQSWGPDALFRDLRDIAPPWTAAATSPSVPILPAKPCTAA